MKKFLKIPVNNNAKSKKILFYEDDKLVLDLDCKIDYVKPAYYAYYDLKNFNTQKLDIKISPEIGWKPEFSDKKEEYKDFYRSGVHFSPGF